MVELTIDLIRRLGEKKEVQIAGRYVNSNYQDVNLGVMTLADMRGLIAYCAAHGIDPAMVDVSGCDCSTLNIQLRA